MAAKARCPAFADYREMCARLKPDFAFALGRHCDMADEARFLIAERIPFAMEKPCAITAADAHDIAARAAQANLFAAVPFVIRYSPLIDTIRESPPARRCITSCSSSSAAWWIAITSSAWNGCCIATPPAAGRCSILACISSISAACCCPARQLQVVGSAMSNNFARLDIEDHAVVLMRGGGATCMVETGYLYPAPNSVFDLHYSIRTEGHYFAARDNQTLEILDNGRQREVRSMPLTNSFFYPTFVDRHAAPRCPRRAADRRSHRHGGSDGSGRGGLLRLAAHSAGTGASVPSRSAEVICERTKICKIAAPSTVIAAPIASAMTNEPVTSTTNPVAIGDTVPPI